MSENEAALLVDLPWILKDNTKGVDYYLGTPSFSAILHYNRSYFYAAAVSQLADEIERRRTTSTRNEASEDDKTEAPATVATNKQAVS